MADGGRNRSAQFFLIFEGNPGDVLEVAELGWDDAGKVVGYWQNRKEGKN